MLTWDISIIMDVVTNFIQMFSINVKLEEKVIADDNGSPTSNLSGKGLKRTRLL